MSRTVSDSSARNARMAGGLGNMGGGGGGSSGGGGRGSIGVIGGSRSALMSSRRKLESEVSLSCPLERVKFFCVNCFYAILCTTCTTFSAEKN